MRSSALGERAGGLSYTPTGRGDFSVQKVKIAVRRWTRTGCRVRARRLVLVFVWASAGLKAEAGAETHIGMTSLPGVGVGTQRGRSWCARVVHAHQRAPSAVTNWRSPTFGAGLRSVVGIQLLAACHGLAPGSSRGMQLAGCVNEWADGQGRSARGWRQREWAISMLLSMKLRIGTRWLVPSGRRAGS